MSKRHDDELVVGTGEADQECPCKDLRRCIRGLCAEVMSVSTARKWYAFSHSEINVTSLPNTSEETHGSDGDD